MGVWIRNDKMATSNKRVSKWVVGNTKGIKLKMIISF
jgi:hypothetical protein